MRLIDADRVVYILEQLKSHSLTGQMNIGNAIYLICEQPTAYDVDADKVAIALDEINDIISNHVEKYGEFSLFDRTHIDALNYAIDIVKRGGIE